MRPLSFDPQAIRKHLLRHKIATLPEDGSYPTAGVVVGSNGVLYGTTEYGGTGTCNAYTQPPGCGVVFSLTSPSSPGVAWTETTLHSFSSSNGTCNPVGCGGYSDGFYPTTGVVIGSGGILYGTTGGGGTISGGTVFSLTPPADVPSGSGAWTEAVLYDFTAFNTYYFPASAGPSGLTIGRDRKSTRLNSSHLGISYAVFCLK